MNYIVFHKVYAKLLTGPYFTSKYYFSGQRNVGVYVEPSVENIKCPDNMCNMMK